MTKNHSPRRIPVLGLLLSGMISVISLGCEAGPNLDAVPAAKAGCEDTTATLLEESGTMLPGRNCMECHKKGGQAEDYPWAAAGTVFAKANMGKTCNTGGVDGVTVELLDMSGTVLATTTSNATGNFYFSKGEFSSTALVRGRVRKGAVSRTMQVPVNAASGCASCHFPGGAAGDRLYLE